jgi:hypothetical protein
VVVSRFSIFEIGPALKVINNNFQTSSKTAQTFGRKLEVTRCQSDAKELSNLLCDHAHYIPDNPSRLIGSVSNQFDCEIMLSMISMTLLYYQNLEVLRYCDAGRPTFH